MVQISEDVFDNMLWNRVEEFYAAKSYPENFWKDCIEYLHEVGYMNDPNKNDPMYIIDNIAVNGNFKTKEELEDEGMDVDPEWIKFGDYYCIDFQMGL